MESLSGTFAELLFQLNVVCGQRILVCDDAHGYLERSGHTFTLYARGLSVDSAVAILCAAYGFSCSMMGDGGLLIQ